MNIIAEERKKEYRERMLRLYTLHSKIMSQYFDEQSHIIPGRSEKLLNDYLEQYMGQQ
ncbi:MAG: hypothetical protein AABW79_01870 [Nanoarchaeota archaeon]